MVDKDWWQITEFAVEISKTLQEKFNDPKAGVHYNTVDKWFKNLETKRIHYISRSVGEKVYNKEDLYIGCFIAERRRDNKWRLDAIYDDIPNHFEVRPFPDDFRDETSTSIDESLMQNRIMESLQKLMAQQYNMQEEKLKIQMDKMIADQLQESVKMMLPAPVSEEEERNKRISDTFMQMKMENKLEEFAIKEWNKLPDSERTKKVGFFGKREEDFLKRDDFIRKYKKEYKKEDLHKLLEESYSTE